MINMPRVLLVAEHASAKFGGEAALALHYFRVLRARGVPVWLVVHERTRAELQQLFPNDVGRIAYVSDSAVLRALWKFSEKLPNKLANFTTGFVMRILGQIAQQKLAEKIIQEEGITVVHQPMPVSPKEPSLMYGLGVPVIIGPMNGGMDYPPAFQQLQSRFEYWVLWVGRKFSGIMNRLMPGKRRAALLLVANERTQRALPNCLRDVRVDLLVENGVDLSLWKGDMPVSKPGLGGITHFAFLGRLVDWKAVDLLLKAFADASRHNIMSLSIIGDGIERDNLELLAHELGLMGESLQPGKVYFTGWLSQPASAEALKSSDVLVLPSLMECGGAVVLEAMAMGMPVIASNWGGPADYLDSNCGILIDPTSREAFIGGLSAAMSKLANRPDLRAKMGQAGRDKVFLEFDWERKVDKMMELYVSVHQSSRDGFP
jgi:glycosyltransferase involved in cell wall biosynthesis